VRAANQLNLIPDEQEETAKSHTVRRIYDSVDRVESFASLARCYLISMQAVGKVVAKI
jgi:hypothetical protein